MTDKMDVVKIISITKVYVHYFTILLTVNVQCQESDFCMNTSARTSRGVENRKVWRHTFYQKTNVKVVKKSVERDIPIFGPSKRL